MPRTPINYSKCCIYKIEHIENKNLLYVGHTTNYEKRKCEHKSSSKNEKSRGYNSNLYQLIRENGGWEMFKMIELEKYSCNDKREAEKRENEMMKELKATMNSNNSFVIIEDMKEHNKIYYENKKEAVKEYAIENKEKIKERKKIYYQTYKKHLKEKQKRYYDLNKEKNKEYYEKNKEDLLEKNKKYYEKNKEKFKSYYLKRINF
jgi:hypothetical protein